MQTPNGPAEQRSLPIVLAAVVEHVAAGTADQDGGELEAPEDAVSQLALEETPAPKACEWCGDPATGHVIGTAACSACIRGGRTYRVMVALQRWKRGSK